MCLCMWVGLGVGLGVHACVFARVRACMHARVGEACGAGSVVAGARARPRRRAGDALPYPRVLHWPACAPDDRSGYHWWASMASPKWLVNFTDYGHLDLMDPRFPDSVSAGETRVHISPFVSRLPLSAIAQPARQDVVSPERELGLGAPVGHRRVGALAHSSLQGRCGPTIGDATMPLATRVMTCDECGGGH